jgi:hypothetical protein
MPKSRGRRAPRSASTSRGGISRPSRSWRKRIGWPLCAIGGVLFLLGNIGARTGIVFLPFDPHHVIAQFGGGLIGIVGLLWATGS